MDEPIKIKGTKEKKSHRDMGLINEIDALAYSSNVYMFRIAMLLGGANYVYDGPLKINDAAFETLRRDLGELGLGVKTGIDVPYEELGVHRDRNRTGGLLLDASIGQYDTYTNIQLAQYACTLANGGKRIKPRLMMDSYVDDQDGTANANYTAKPEVLDDVSNQTTAFSQIKQGMRACVTRSNGTCNAFWSGKSYITYAKTGTAEDYTGTGDTEPSYKEKKPLGLFFFFMYSFFITSWTVFIYFHSIWMISFIFCINVIFFTTFSTFKNDIFSHYLHLHL